MTVKVYVLGRPEFGEAYERFLNDYLPKQDRSWRQSDDATAAERLVEFAGRICYMSFGSRQSPNTNAEYIQKLITNRHESVLEHASWTVLITGVSRAFTHQLVRHRVGFSFSQLSQQYHDESDVRFVLPHGLEQFPDLMEIWDKTTRNAQIAYRRILGELSDPAAPSMAQEHREALRAIRSAARSVLPNASETAIVVTFNARSLRHFLGTRGNIVGDTEMRCVSAALLETIRPEGPALFFDFKIEYLDDSLPLVLQVSSE
jgi:thymidylate synthase (FAD)